MQKENLIHLHTVLAKVKRHLESEGVRVDFSRYEALHISPVHIHRNKTDHERAIFALGDAIVEAIGRQESPKRIVETGLREVLKKDLKEKGLAGLKA